MWNNGITCDSESNVPRHKPRRLHPVTDYLYKQNRQYVDRVK